MNSISRLKSLTISRFFRRDPRLIDMAQSIGDMEEGSSRTTSVFSSAHKESLYRGHDLSSKGSFEIEDWDNDPANPYNWSTRRKVQQVVAVSFATFTT